MVFLKREYETGNQRAVTSVIVNKRKRFDTLCTEKGGGYVARQKILWS